MQMASSAKRTCSELRSASLYTATVRMPSSLQAQITRRAISPRLAMRTFLNMSRRLLRTNREQRLAVLDWLAVGREFLHHFAGHVTFNLVHQLHRFDDAE